MLWIVFAILTLFVIGALLYPILKGGAQQTPQRVDFDIVVYRSQLAELEQEIENGLLTKDQADAARSEIHHRMLDAEDAERQNPVRRKWVQGRYARLAAIFVIGGVVPIGAVVTYDLLGSPQLSGEPYAWRQQHDPDFVAASSADNLAKSLQGSTDIASYKRLAQMYFSARNYENSVVASRRAIELGANDAGSWSTLGEGIVMSNGGSVVPEALVAFTSALGIDPHDNRARFYIGLAEAQIGNLRHAVAIWRDLEKDGDPNASWLPLVRQHIAAFSKGGGFDPNSVPPSPPSLSALRMAISAMTGAMQKPGQMSAADQPAAAASPSGGSDQDVAIRNMVAHFADRMKQTPGDVAGWTRLAHAYNVLGDHDKAREAINHAIKLQPNNVNALLTLAETEKANALPGNDMPKDFVSTMHQILVHDPANASALYYLGLEEQKAGNGKKARDMWSKALAKVAPDDPLAGRLRDELGLPSNPATSQ